MPSKLSIHLSGYPEKTFTVLQQMQPSVVKVFNMSSEINIAAIRRVCNPIIVYRQYTNLSYRDSADAFFAELGDTFNKLRGLNLLWEGLNEPIIGTIEDAQALNAWYVRFAEIMHAYGEKVAGFSWSTGNPTPDKLHLIIPHLAEAAAAVDVHAFHEYYSTWGGSKDWAYYRVFEEALPANARKPVVITEAGLDDNGDNYTGGWLWQGKVSAQEYLDILKAYDQVLMQDPYVLGATVFQWGDYGWPSFELNLMIDMIAQYVASVGGGVVIPTPWPIPEFELPEPYSLSVTPDTIVAGDSATLKWDVESAQEVYLDDQSVDMHGSRTVAPTETATFALHIVLLDGTTKDLTATLTVTAAPPTTHTFSVTPETICLGQSATLQWDVEGVREVYLNGEGVPGHKTRTVTPTETTTYTLHIVFRDGSTNDLTATVTVVPVMIFSLTATPDRVMVGEAATLRWSVVGAKQVTLDGASVAFTDSRTVSPMQTTTYTLHILWVDGRTEDSSITVTVTEAPPPFFSVIPDTLALGKSATLEWNVIGAGTVFLDGQPVSSSGTLTVKPMETTTYTLRVVYPDGRSQETSAKVTVTSPPGGPTRPPTVTITAENIARLRTFPRPAQDNGRGLHFDIDLRDPSIQQTVARLLSINAKWTMIYAQDELQAKRAAQACWSAGIMPIIRIGKKVDQPFDPIQYVNALKSIGAPPYVQIYNEPGDVREWNQWPGDSAWVGLFAQRWAEHAAAVFDADGYPGLQVLSQGEFEAAVDSVQAIGRTDIWQRAFFALHNYGANHPPAYPYDSRNQQDHPGATILDDDTAVLNLLEYAKWMKDRLGFVLPIIGGEGGWEFGSAEDPRYPKVEQPYHAQYHAEMFDWFRPGVIGNGEPLPDYLFSITPWIVGGWGADDWWGGPLGDKTETINAVKAIPPFVRKFSWGEGLPPTYSFTANPTTIQVGASATLQWSVTGVHMVTLDGQAVAYQGTRVVAPTRTTTYILHIVFDDGSTRDMHATVTVTTAPLPPTLEWDPRLDALGVKLKRTDAASAWRLVSAKYQDETQSGGNHHIYFKALNADGTPKAGLKFLTDWVGRDPGDQPAIVTTDANGEANCALWAILHPELQDGPYFTFVKDAASDTVSGMGLPMNRHVNFILTFQWSGGAPPLPPTYTFTASPATIQSGQSSTLQWNVTGARSLTLNGEVVANQGTKAVAPLQTTTYVLHVVFADGSTKDLNAQVTVTPSNKIVIKHVTFAPTALGTGELLEVSITLWNDTDEPLQTQGPNPGFVYEEGETFSTWGFPAVKGAVRVGVDFDGRTGVDYPYRWGLGAPLAPGQTATITGAIRLKTTRAINYWVGLVRELVAWLEDRKGVQKITVTAQPPPPPPPSGLEWDPRLDALGVKLTRTDAAHAWRLISARYQAPDESEGKHHLYFKALNADGSPKAGLRFVIDWIGRSPSSEPAVVTTDASGEANCPLWVAMDPAQQNGICFTLTKDVPSDQVSGMGLPNGRYVNFILTFKYG